VQLRRAARRSLRPVFDVSFVTADTGNVRSSSLESVGGVLLERSVRGRNCSRGPPRQVGSAFLRSNRGAASRNLDHADMGGALPCVGVNGMRVSLWPHPGSNEAPLPTVARRPAR